MGLEDRAAREMEGPFRRRNFGMPERVPVLRGRSCPHFAQRFPFLTNSAGGDFVALRGGESFDGGSVAGWRWLSAVGDPGGAVAKRNFPGDAVCNREGEGALVVTRGCAARCRRKSQIGLFKRIIIPSDRSQAHPDDDDTRIGGVVPSPGGDFETWLWSVRTKRARVEKLNKQHQECGHRTAGETGTAPSHAFCEKQAGESPGQVNSAPGA